MRRRSSACWTIAIAIAAGSTIVMADTVKLRTGKSVEGSFMSADVNTVRLLLANGSIAQFPVKDILALEFSARKAPPPPAPDPSRAPSPVTVPAGTLLHVRLVDSLDVDAARTGVTYKTLLDDPVMIGGSVVVPRGSVVTVQAVKVEQAGKMKGADKITLKAKTLAFGGRTYDIVTTAVEHKGGGEGRKTSRKMAGGAGLGAIVGGIAGGGSGAAIGAVAGGATGAIVASQGTEHLVLPAETRLQFSLDAAVTVQP
jgi:hypothetical protein